MTRGGKRKGAGRKPARGVAKATMSITVTPEVLEYLAQREESRGETIEAAIRRTQAFREWQKTRSG